MSRRDRAFLLSVAGLTVLVALPVALLRPLAEERAALGTALGWGLAILIMVPSYVLLSRALAEANPHRFVGAFMTGAILRLGLTLLGVLGFWLAFRPAPPMRSFVFALLGGYVLLTTVELLLVRGGGRSSTAEERTP